MSFNVQSLNQVTLIGRLADAPKIGTSAKGTQYATMVVVTTQCYRDAQNQLQTKATFIPCALFGQNEHIAKLNLGKGDLVYVGGSISLTEKGEGEQRQVNFSIRIAEITLLARKAAPSAQQGQAARPAQQNAPAKAARKAAQTAVKPKANDLPFDDEPQDLP